MTLPLATKIARITQKREKLEEKVQTLSQQIRLLDLEITYLNQVQIFEAAPKIPQRGIYVLAEPPRPESIGSPVPLPVPSKPKGDCPSCSDGVTRPILRTLGNGKTITLRVCGDCGNEQL